MMAGAMMFALPSCAGLLDMMNEEGEEEENVDEGENGQAGEELPPYYNFKTEDSGNTIVFSFSFRAGNEPYYDVKYEWTFSDDVCTKCIETITCKTEAIAVIVAVEYDDDPNTSVSGRDIVINVTEDYAEETRDDIRLYVQQLQAAMELINDQATNPGE